MKKYQSYHVSPDYNGRIIPLEKLVSLCKNYGARNFKAAYYMMNSYMLLSGHNSLSQLAKFTSKKENWNAFKTWLQYGPQIKKQL